MTDESGRRGRAQQDPDDWDDDDLGDPIFADESVDDVPLRFGPDESGPMPHWTAPPTGEIPRIFAEKEPGEGVDIWGNYAQPTAAGPVWRDSGHAGDETATVADLGLESIAPLGALDERGTEDEDDLFFDLAESPPAAAPEPEPPRPREPIRIGSDPTGDAPTPLRQRSGGPTRAGGRPGPDDSRGAPRPGAGAQGRSARPAPTGGTAGRDMPTAVAIGLGLAAVFVLVTKFAKSTGVMAIVVAVLGLAAVEFFEKTQERGYRPATVTGIAAAVLIPLAAYWQGEIGIVLGLFLAVLATVVTMMSAPTGDGQPLVNGAITLVGIGWIALLGSFAGLILAGDGALGTDTIFALVIAVVANDVGALLVGSAGGRTPLRPWISPNKTVEGLIGGAVVTIGSMILLNIANTERSTWISLSDCIALGVVVAILAPIGDLTESMFKRSLDIKDFGTLLPGHGGILDRFDGFLFTLPAAYYLLVTLEPYTNIR